ncbi:Ribosome-associated [Macleaya cordata]|uniref:Ribosome-associated n=1 Tax=Macleaya cordata TaxID=56857 RepID=A0A200RAA1_MACCD|nr:Ribosome-associated [Macleaya cordata]
MAQVIRPLRTQQPIICSSCSTFLRILSPFLPNKSSTSPLQQHHHQRRRLTSFVTLPLSNRNVDFRSHGLRLSESALPPDLAENDSDSDYSSSEKSRNAKKREARRAVKWGMELASFSAPQIKRILSVASLEREVFEALMLVKRLGPDVREGKRRQFNYIGRLLRKVEPELMDALIQASKEGDNSKLQALSGTGPSTIVEDEEELEEIESEEEEEEGLHISHNYIDLATRWIEGLISKDSDITNEVYSIHSVEFDRQELRKLVRRVHSIQEQQLKSENEGASDTALVGARKSLSLFLRSLAKQMPIEEDH